MPTLINGKVTYQGGEALPNVESSAYLAAQNGEINPKNSYTGYNQPDGSMVLPSATTPITSSSVNSSVPYNLPTPNITPTTGNLNIATGSALAAAKTDALYTPPVNTTPSISDSLSALTKEITGNQAEINTLSNDSELQRKKIAAQNLSNEVDQLDKNFQDEVKQIKETFQGTTAGLQDKLDIARERYSNTRANMALSYRVAAQDYQGAQEIITNKIQSLKDSNAQQIQLYQLTADAIRNDLTASESKILEDKLASKKAMATAVTTVYSDVMKALASNPNTPASVYSAVDSVAKNPNATIADIYSAAGQYARTQDLTYKELPDGRAVMIDKQGNIEKVITTKGSGNVITLTPEQKSDPFLQKLANSAGGKPITDTFAQQLNKGLTVLGQIGSLQTNIKDTNTGPIVGAFRGNNPWDTNAETIKSQLNAIIPNLARGVYGEVGVLTDNDIKQYAKTLPNLTSTEAVRNAILGITVDLIAKSIKRNLDINASNGKDVSGFIDIYTEMQATRDSIFSQIPGYQGTLSSKNNPFIEATAGGSSIINPTGGFNIPNK